MKITSIKKPKIYYYNTKQLDNFFHSSILNVDCGEVTLFSKECCNLVEQFLNNIESKEQLIDCALLLYKTQKAIAALDFLHDETTEVVRKNMRLGMGITGICQSLDKIDWLDDTYKALKQFDKEWSAKKGYPESIKLTAVKPSGCGVLNTKIKTTNGDLSFEEIFHHFDIDIENFDNELNGIWFDLTNNENKIKVFDRNNSEKEITKLFLNGLDNVYEFETEDGSTHQFTEDHKFLVIRDEKEMMVKVKDLKENDDIKNWN